MKIYLAWAASVSKADPAYSQANEYKVSYDKLHSEVSTFVATLPDSMAQRNALLQLGLVITNMKLVSMADTPRLG